MMLLIRILHFVAYNCYDNNFCGKVYRVQCAYAPRAHVRNMHLIAFYDVIDIHSVYPGST